MSPKKIIFLAHSLTKVLRQILLHNRALEYRGKIFVNDFVTVGKKFEYNFQNCSWMVVLICHCGGTCLIRILLSKSSK